MTPVIVMIGGVYLVHAGITDGTVLWGLGSIIIGIGCVYVGVASIMGWPA